MPSQLHEALLLLFRNRPALAPELLRDVLQVALPAMAHGQDADIGRAAQIALAAQMASLGLDEDRSKLMEWTHLHFERRQ
jgi:hypothetical protein